MASAYRALHHTANPALSLLQNLHQHRDRPITHTRRAMNDIQVSSNPSIAAQQLASERASINAYPYLTPETKGWRIRYVERAFADARFGEKGPINVFRGSIKECAAQEKGSECFNGHVCLKRGRGIGAIRQPISEAGLPGYFLKSFWIPPCLFLDENNSPPNQPILCFTNPFRNSEFPTFQSLRFNPHRDLCLAFGNEYLPVS